jgi:hypothetical protein
MLPFLDEKELKELASEINRSPTDEVDGLTMSSLLPFLDDDDLYDIALERAKMDKSITGFFPFMDDDDLARLAKNKDIRIDLKAIIPFLDEDEVKDVIIRLIENGDTADLVHYLPFADEDDLEPIMISYAKSGKDPYVFYPFVEDDALSDLLSLVLKGVLLNIDLDKLYPFLDDDDIERLFEAYLKQKGKGTEIMIRKR